MVNILLLDDEPNVVSSLKRILKKEPWQITGHTDAETALEEIRSKSNTDEAFNVVVSDYRMPKMNGIDFLILVKQLSPDTVRIVLSGQADMKAMMDSINRAEIYRFLSKPINPEELIFTLRVSLKHYALVLENKKLANLMRQQNKIIDVQKNELERLEQESPGITNVDLDEHGSVILNVEEYLLHHSDPWNKDI